jgi:hypothetical protein
LYSGFVRIEHKSFALSIGRVGSRLLVLIPAEKTMGVPKLPGGTTAKLLLCGAMLLWGATALRASQFDFSYSGTGIPGAVTASGVITATEELPGIYEITGLTGTQNGKTISLDGTGSTFIYSGSSGTGTLEFLVAGLGADSVAFAGSIFSESGVTGADTGSNFTLSDPPLAAPEPPSLSLLLIGLGGLLFARILLQRSKASVAATLDCAS